MSDYDYLLPICSRQKRKEEEDKLSGKIDKLINNQFSDNGSDEESEEEADWRSRELF